MNHELVDENLEEGEKKVLDLAAYAGHVLLENGAEIFRVEETMERIANAYGMKGDHSFVLSSGIFLTEETTGHGIYANVKHIPLHSVNLHKVTRVNQLSREISMGLYSVDDAMSELKKISEENETNRIKVMLAYGIGSGSFCYIFGGGLRDSIAAFFCGLLLFWFVYAFNHRKKKTSKIVLNILSGIMVSIVCFLLHKLQIGSDLNHMIIGSIMPLLPGVAFTNAIRDLANEDYISGTIRMVDAILVGICIAIGVGVVYSIYTRIFPGGLM